MEKLKYIFDNAKVGIAICNATDNTLEMVNPAFAHIHGYAPHELIGVSPCKVFAPECMLRLKEHENTISCSINDVSFETIHYKKDGSPVPVSVHITIIKNANGVIKQRIANIQDISERRNQDIVMQIKEDQLRALAENIPGFAYTYRLLPDGREEFIYVSNGIIDIYGITPQAALSSIVNIREIMHPDDVIHFRAVIAESASSLIPFQTDFRVIHPKKGQLWVESRGIPKKIDADGSIIWHGITLDITERKLAQQMIEHLAHHDALTGLPNRILAKEKMEQAITYAKNNNIKTALLFIDLDEFKSINDSLGHSFGDAMLKSVSSRLSECIRTTDTLSRHGGDEFLLLLPNINDKEDIVTIADKFLRAFEQSFHVNQHELFVSASIGIAMYPEHGETFEALLQSADTAMYQAKESGKNGYCFYTRQMTHNLIGQFTIQNDLKSALRNNEFTLHYQPQIDIDHNRIMGAEALVRWNHPQLGMIPPMSFIPVAESSGLIVSIGDWVLHEACMQAAIWQKLSMNMTVAVNISAMQFKRGNLEAVVKHALASSGLNPQFLELELTESILIHDTENILLTVRNLKALGVKLSIDDFGTGYSSLSYLKRFSVDKLKIDQSFVHDILNDHEDAAIVRTIIQMAKSLNLKTIAEGVESAEVCNVIKAYGCNEVQGYHFAKPMEALHFKQYHTDFYNLINP